MCTGCAFVCVLLCVCVCACVRAFSAHGLGIYIQGPTAGLLQGADSAYQHLKFHQKAQKPLKHVVTEFVTLEEFIFNNYTLMYRHTHTQTQIVYTLKGRESLHHVKKSAIKKKQAYRSESKTV